MKQKRESVLNYPDEATREMALPKGKNCGGCYLFPRCRDFIGIEEENEVCDFWPNRFLSLESLFMKA